MSQLSLRPEVEAPGPARREAPSGDGPAPPGRPARAAGVAFEDNHVHDPDPVPAGRHAELWDEGRSAARAADHARALVCFVLEAQRRTAQGSHGRAAIAYRAAAGQARLQGDPDAADDLLDRAAAAYTDAAERSDLPPRAARQAWVSAAKCALQLSQLDRAAECIERARRIVDGGRRERTPEQTAS